MRLPFVLILLLTLTASLMSQEKSLPIEELPSTPKAYVAPQDISGTWVGELFQDAGGIADKFEFSMEIRQIGRAIKGTTYVRLNDIWAEMDFSGYLLPNGSWRIMEKGIVRSQKPIELSWCMKHYKLSMDYTAEGLLLTGPWWGDSDFGPCIPGSVRLRRGIKRA